MIGAVPVTIGAVLIDPLSNPFELSGPAVVALVYVLALPMVFCHWAWFSVVRLFPAAIAAAGTLAIPVVGVLSGVIMLGEPLGWREVSALVLVCAALVFVLLIPAWRGNARKAAQIKR
jgi:drug/metabolite transporter (DMT)-like permease